MLGNAHSSEVVCCEVCSLELYGILEENEVYTFCTRMYRSNIYQHHYNVTVAINTRLVVLHSLRHGIAICSTEIRNIKGTALFRVAD